MTSSRQLNWTTSCNWACKNDVLFQFTWPWSTHKFMSLYTVSIGRPALAPSHTENITTGHRASTRPNSSQYDGVADPIPYTSIFLSTWNCPYSIILASKSARTTPSTPRFNVYLIWRQDQRNSRTYGRDSLLGLPRKMTFPILPIFHDVTHCQQLSTNLLSLKTRINRFILLVKCFAPSWNALICIDLPRYRWSRFAAAASSSKSHVIDWHYR